MLPARRQREGLLSNFLAVCRRHAACPVTQGLLGARVAVRYGQPSQSDRRRAQKIADLALGVLFVIGGEQGFHTAEPSIERAICWSQSSS
jgi:hypothetical protein